MKVVGCYFNPIQDEGQEAPYQFFSTSLSYKNVGISPKNFVTFSFDPSTTLM